MSKATCAYITSDSLAWKGLNPSKSDCGVTHVVCVVSLAWYFSSISTSNGCVADTLCNIILRLANDDGQWICSTSIECVM